MAEYIEREALREILDGWRDAHADVDDVHGCGLLEDVICEVDAQTAADVAPVVHAHWAQTSKGVIYCSNCGAVCGIGAHIEEVTEDHYFCYYCGARMDGGDTNA